MFVERTEGGMNLELKVWAREQLGLGRGGRGAERPEVGGWTRRRKSSFAPLPDVVSVLQGPRVK